MLGHQDVAFVCDLIKEREGSLTAAYNEFKIRYPVLAAHMKGISHLDDKLRPELQIADLMASAGRREVAKRIADPEYKTDMSLRCVRVDCLQRRGMLEIIQGNIKGT
jgi:hypothetical protein